LAGLAGWREVLKPLLDKKFNNSWIDPRGAKNDEDLLYKYKTAWAHAEAGKEIIALIETYVETANFLEKKEKGEVVDKFRNIYGGGK